MHPEPDRSRRRAMAITRRRRRVRPLPLLFALAAGFLLLTAGPVFLLGHVNPPTTSFMLHARWDAWRAGRDDYRTRYLWLDWEKISPHAALAVIAAEDQLFPEHSGFDIEAIRKAWQHNQSHRRVRGASTISQQVAKNLFLWSGRSFLRKGLEAWFTTLIEMMWSKRRTLEMYLNIAQFGDGIYGVPAAATHLLHKPPAALRPRDAALLAAVLPNPIVYRVDKPSRYVLERRAWIERQMRQLGGIDYLGRLSD
jgi:monofunctional biosynthetic peptidoglycan transglycosylase